MTAVLAAASQDGAMTTADWLMGGLIFACLLGPMLYGLIASDRERGQAAV